MTSFVKYESNLGRVAIDRNPFHVSRRVSLLLKSVCSLTSAILRRSNTTTRRSQQESMKKGHYNSHTEICFGYFGRSSSNSDSIFPRRSCFWVLMSLQAHTSPYGRGDDVLGFLQSSDVSFWSADSRAQLSRMTKKSIHRFLRVSAHEQWMVKSIIIEDIVLEGMMERWEEASCCVAQLTRKSSPELWPRTFIHGSRHAKCHAIRESYGLDFLPVIIVYVFLKEFDSVNDIR